MEWDAEPNAAGFYLRMGAQHLRTTVSRSGRTLPVMGIATGAQRMPTDDATTQQQRT